MLIDSRQYPVGYAFAEVAARGLGVHVHVANFQEHHGRVMFRMIIDGELDKSQLTTLMGAEVRDSQSTYHFSHMEILSGPVVDQGPSRGKTTNYLRVTFM